MMDESRGKVKEKTSHIQTLERELKAVEGKIRATHKELEVQEIALCACFEISDDVLSVHQTHLEIKSLDESIAELRRQNSSLGECRGLQDFKKEEDTVHRKLKALRAAVEAKEKTVQDAEQKQLRLQQDINRLDAERLDIEKRQQGKVALTKKKEELEESVSTLKEDVNAAETEMAGVEEEVAEEMKHKNRLSAAKTKAVDAAKKELDQLKDDQKELVDLEKAISRYRESGEEFTNRCLD
jgi:chromosome segregation ATPase